MSARQLKCQEVFRYRIRRPAVFGSDFTSIPLRKILQALCTSARTEFLVVSDCCCALLRDAHSSKMKITASDVMRSMNEFEMPERSRDELPFIAPIVTHVLCSQTRSATHQAAPQLIDRAGKPSGSCE